MRKIIWFTFGALEITLAISVLIFARQLPRNEHIRTEFGHFAEVSDGAERQVASIQKNINHLRRPEITQTPERLGEQTKRLNQLIRHQRIDFETLRALRDSLGAISGSLDTWADALEAERMAALAEALGTTAEMLDKDVVPASKRAAEGMKESTDLVARDAERLGMILRQTAPDLKALREVHDSLVRVENSLERVAPVLKLERIDEMRDGFAGMESAMSKTADQVDQAANFTYPVVKLNGLRTEVEQKSFWPGGGEIAAGLRKSLGGLRAAKDELDTVEKHLPALRTSLDASRDSVTSTRKAMAEALENEEELNNLLRDAPDRTANLAEQLPAVGRSFEGMLRGLDKLESVATSLRKAQAGLDVTRKKWPATRASLKESAEVLNRSRDQFDKMLDQQEEFEEALNASTELADRFAEIAPELSAGLDNRLGEQAASMEQIRVGLSQVNRSLPQLEQSTINLFDTARWLLWLVAALIGLHGLYISVDAIRSGSGSDDKVTR